MAEINTPAEDEFSLEVRIEKTLGAAAHRLAESEFEKEFAEELDHELRRRND